MGKRQIKVFFGPKVAQLFMERYVKDFIDDSRKLRTFPESFRHPKEQVVWALKTLKGFATQDALDELIILTNSPYIILPLALSQSKQGLRALLEELKEEFGIDIKMDLEDMPEVKFYLVDSSNVGPKEISAEEIYDGIPTIFEVDVALTRALNSF